MTLEDARKYFVYRLPIIRGISILAVITAHIPPYGRTFSFFCVPVFVLLSGMYLSLNRRNERAISFYRRTLKYLLIPYLFYSLVYSIPRVIRGWTPVELWHGFLSSEIEAHLWFMPAIIGLYLLHPWLRRLYRTSSAGLLIVTFALQLWGWPYAKANILCEAALITLFSFMAMLGYFVAGYVILDHAKAAKWCCEHWMGRLASVTVWLLWPIVYSWPAVTEILSPFLKVLVASSSVAAFFVLASIGRPKTRVWQSIAAWITSFGLYSYGVYLIHPLVISAASRIVTWFTNMSSGEVLWRLLVFAMTAPVSLIIVKWLAKRPLGRYIT